MKSFPEEFGGGEFTIGINQTSYSTMSASDQARHMAWFAGCPIVEELIAPDKRGPEAMRDRYTEISSWFLNIVNRVGKPNPNLQSQLTERVPRIASEPVGKYEPQSVPDWYTSTMPPMGTLVGYALPRLMIEQIGSDLPKSNGNDQREAERLANGLDALEVAIPVSTTPEELLVKFGQQLAFQGDIVPIRIIKRMLPADWYKEHGATSLLEEVVAAMWEHAPALSNVYSQLSESEKAHNKIA